MYASVAANVRVMRRKDALMNGRVIYPIVISDKKPSTPWCSRAVPQLSTDLALHRLAMEFGWDPAFSMQYGRRLLMTNV
jgi:hypothetical protein